MAEDVRWEQRLENLERAVALLREPLVRGATELSDLEKAGTVKRFEMAVELAWKTLKDYLLYEGREVLPAAPKPVVKEAFAAGVLDDGQVWVDMLDHRNALPHRYDEEAGAGALAAMAERYLPALEVLCGWLGARRTA